MIHPAFCPRCGTTTTAPRDGCQDCAECGQPVTIAMYASPADWRAKKITPEEGLRRLREIVGDSLDGVSIREALGRVVAIDLDAIRARYARIGTPKLLWQEVCIDIAAMADEIARLRGEIAELAAKDDTSMWVDGDDGGVG